MNKKSLWLGSVALLLVATLLVFSQTSSQFPELDKNGKPLLPRRCRTWSILQPTWRTTP